MLQIAHSVFVVHCRPVGSRRIRKELIPPYRAATVEVSPPIVMVKWTRPFGWGPGTTVGPVYPQRRIHGPNLPDSMPDDED